MESFLETYPNSTPDDFENPYWDDDARIHEWKNYVSEEVRILWPTFSKELKAVLARQSHAMAALEHWD